MKKILSILLFTGFGFTQVNGQTAPQKTSADIEPLLQGKTYTIRIKQLSETKKGTQYGKEEAEEFSFKGGKFKTLMFTRDYGLAVKPYEITNVDTATGTQIISWECQIPSGDKDLVIFKGDIEGGNAIKGTVEWTVKDKPKKTIRYEYEGELKEKKKKTTSK